MRNLHLPGRSPVYARRAMCATSHPLASRVAVRILEDGGSAVDAAIAASATLCVVEPHMTGIGGDCFAMVHTPASGLELLSGAGRAPAAISPEALRREGLGEIPDNHPAAVTVPGAIDAWARLHERHGRLAWSALLAPAIAYARDGFAVAPRVARDWKGLEEKLARDAGARRHLLLEDGRAPGLGETMRFPALGETLSTIAREGRDGFYGGWVTDQVVGPFKGGRGSWGW